MSQIEDALAFYLNQPDHPIPNCDFVVEMLLDIVPGIVLPRIGTQVDHIGIDRQAVLPNSMSDIARHAAWHGRIGAVSRLKLVVDQYLLVIDTHANQAIGLACFNSVLFCVHDCKNFNVLAPEGKASKVTGVFLNQVFGNRIKFCHVKCLASGGVSAWDTRNTQTQSKYQANYHRIEREFVLADI